MEKSEKKNWRLIRRPMLKVALVLFVSYVIVTIIFPWLKVTTIRDQQKSYVDEIEKYIKESEMILSMNDEWLNSISIHVHFAEGAKKVPFVMYLPFYAPESTLKYDKESAIIAPKTFGSNTLLTIFPRTTTDVLNIDFEDRNGDIGKQLIARIDMGHSITVRVNITAPSYNSWLDNSALILSSFTRVMLDVPGEHHYYSKAESKFADTLSYGNSYTLTNIDGKFSMQYVIGSQYNDRGKPELSWENITKLFSEAFFSLVLDIFLLIVTFIFSGYDPQKIVRYRIATMVIIVGWAIMITFYFIFDDPNKGVVASVFCLLAIILYITRWLVSRSRSIPATG